MTEPFVGEVQIYGFPFAPRYWAFADGSTLAIRQSGTLYSLYGTQFGGDGVTTFALPNLTSRMACGAGQSPGNSRRSLGQTFGSASVALTNAEMPPHTHTLYDYQPGEASQLVPLPTAVEGLGYAIGEAFTPFANPGTPTTMDPNALGQTGAGAAHENRQPFLGLNYAVALMGNYPTFD